MEGCLRRSLRAASETGDRLGDQRSRLDHVAIHVGDRGAFVDTLLDLLDVRVLEQTERFTLIGAHPDHGKLTLLDADDHRAPVPNRIVSIMLAESAGTAAAPPVTLTGGLVLTFASVDDLGADWADTPRHAVVGVTLRAQDPPIAGARLEAEHRMRLGMVGPDHAVLDVGATPSCGRITLSREAWATDGPSMLDHVGIRVEDAGAWRAAAESSGIEVMRWVEAPHSRAVFVSGPEDLLLEFVELTAPIGTS